MLLVLPISLTSVRNDMITVQVTYKELQLLITLLGEAQCKVKDVVNPRALYDELKEKLNVSDPHGDPEDNRV